MRQPARFGLVLAALVAAAGAVQAAPLQNGGFEDTNGAPNSGGIYSYGTGNTMTGWSVTSGNVEILNDNVATSWGTAHSGDHFLDLNGTTAGAIQQSFTTVASQMYTVDFWYRRNAGTVEQPAPLMSIAAALVPEGGPSAGTFVFAVDSANWTQGSFNFTAAGGMSTLSFTSMLNSSASGVFLDTVTVSAVPEPASIALALAGLAVVSVGARRRSAS